MLDFLRINSSIRVHAAATRLNYLRASNDAVAIASADADGRRREGGERRKYVWMQCVNKR